MKGVKIALSALLMVICFCTAWYCGISSLFMLGDTDPKTVHTTHPWALAFIGFAIFSTGLFFLGLFFSFAVGDISKTLMSASMGRIRGTSSRRLSQDFRLLGFVTLTGVVALKEDFPVVWRERPCRDGQHLHSQCRHFCG